MLIEPGVAGVVQSMTADAEEQGAVEAALTGTLDPPSARERAAREGWACLSLACNLVEDEELSRDEAMSFQRELCAQVAGLHPSVAAPSCPAVWGAFLEACGQHLRAGRDYAGTLNVAWRVFAFEHFAGALRSAAATLGPGRLLTADEAKLFALEILDAMATCSPLNGVQRDLLKRAWVTANRTDGRVGPELASVFFVPAVNGEDPMAGSTAAEARCCCHTLTIRERRRNPGQSRPG